MNDKFDELGKGLGQSVVRWRALWRLGGSIAFLILGLESPTFAQGLGFQRLSVYQTGCCPYTVAVANNLAYIPAASAGFQILSVSNPANPIVISRLITMQEPVNVVVVGQRAYVAEVPTTDLKTGRLDIINISVPSQPVVEGGLYVTGAATVVQVAGNIAYLACRRYPVVGGPEGIGGRLYAIDVNNPVQPTLVGELDLPGDPAALVVKQTNAYLAEVKFNAQGNFAGGHFQAVDLTVPSQPVTSAQLSLDGVGWGVDVSGQIAYVAEAFVDNDGTTNRLRTYDISAPSSPKQIGAYNTRGWASRVKVIGSHVWLVNANAGVELIDVANPSEPYGIGFIPVEDFVNGLAVVSNKAYIVAPSLGLLAYQFTIAPKLGIVRDAGTGYLVRFSGVPDLPYRLQRAADVAGPWVTSAPQIAPACGLVEIWDLFPPPGQAFYRTVQP